MKNKKHKIGKIEKHKGGWSMTSETTFPKYFHTFWCVDIPMLKKKEEMKPGDTMATGLCFYNKTDAEIFSEFLKGHMKKYIKQLHKTKEI